MCEAARTSITHCVRGGRSGLDASRPAPRADLSPQRRDDTRSRLSAYALNGRGVWPGSRGHLALSQDPGCVYIYNTGMPLGHSVPGSIGRATDLIFPLGAAGTGSRCFASKPHMNAGKCDVACAASAARFFLYLLYCTRSHGVNMVLPIPYSVVRRDKEYSTKRIMQQACGAARKYRTIGDCAGRCNCELTDSAKCICVQYTVCRPTEGANTK